MVFIALPPLLRRCFLPLLAFIGLASASFARPIFLAVDSTPYDRQMLRVQPVLAAENRNPGGEISLAVVNQWMNRLRGIPYQYSKQWQTPREVNMAKRGDCKGKAMALYAMMHRFGATDVRFVIGRHRTGDWFTHAWLEWETANGRYVLDPTFNRQAVAMARANPSTYIPLYAYEGAFRYRALNVNPIPEVPLRAVASGKRNWTRTSFPGLE